MYELGEGGSADEEKAAEFYKKAARQGDALANQRLASLYLRGAGVEKDMIKAAALFIVGDGENLSDSSQELLSIMKPEQKKRFGRSA
ncbi:sel1 repeat family protein [Pseudomonas mangiferae]|uniref:Sel1 repeat family protein n=2 Tax=Pseudomonas mangiferae TaxID=2593654 RepID=A0A553GUE0_9PSED|nr:sel1 repeat family protein [Pseudomonas mangiferae]